MATPEPRPAADAHLRERALDPRASFIVQAPAGSGKTELLIQRLLVLLATVERPEQVLAITFTRKAAAEMRARLLDALAAADAAAPPPAAGHEAATRARAAAVVARDRALGWALQESPARLRIQTIDSLCAALTRERPLRSGLGEPAGIAEDADALYRAAARATLAALEGEGPAADAVARLLLHLDDNQARAEALLCTMLARRDQWLRHLPALGGAGARGAGTSGAGASGAGAPGAGARSDDAALRGALEAELRAAIAEALGDVQAALSAAAGGAGNAPALAAELVAVADCAGRQLARADGAAPIARLRGLAALPPATAEALPLWQGLAELLTTADGKWRRTLNKNHGFPTDKAAGDPAALKADKARGLALLQGLAALADAPELERRVGGVRRLPPPQYGDAQWRVLAALLAVLPPAVRELRRVFAAAGETDYTEVALAAVQALQGGSDADPGGTGAGARDDARHILVDEFQDTSHAQFRLLECLSAGWPADGSQTLFLVGDPMQSIYRFREAEVGLFLRARQAGVGQLRLEPLRLSVNFRSDAGLVEWVNGVFPGVLAPQEVLATGAVPFSPAVAHRPAGAAPAVAVHPLLQAAGQPRAAVDAAEGARIAQIVADARRERPEDSVAILVRTRAHLAAVLPALQRAGLAFQAVEIEALAERPEVQDLLMLARALTHRGDRVAWLAVLRAPWCGLPLAELLALAGPDADATLWERLGDPALRRGLSDDGRARVERLLAALGPALQRRERRSLRRWLESAWLALGGPATVAPGALPNVEACLARLEALRPEQQPGDPAAFAALLERLYAAPDPGADARLQVLSMHKAKGLQFDTVILPGLGRVPRSDEPPLLRWVERPVPAPQGAGLLLAPIHDAGSQSDPHYAYLAALERERAQHETGRLLYVAVTRARHTLHLLGHAELRDGSATAPDGRSLLARLWPAVEAEFARAAQDTKAAAAAAADRAAPAAAPAASALDGAGLRRLVPSWQPPAPPAAVPQVAPAETAPALPHDAIEFRWAGETARHVGTVVHRLLRLIARHSAEPATLARWQGGAGAFGAGAIAAALGALGVPAAEHAAASARVVEAVRRTLADERGRWLLAPHSEGRSEYALTGLSDGAPAHFVIDRTFVDDAGVRWIVDFKTGSHEGGDLDAFLAREQERYRAQLEGYAALLARLEPGRPIRLALYFPLLQAWRDWPAPVGG